MLLRGWRWRAGNTTLTDQINRNRLQSLSGRTNHQITIIPQIHGQKGSALRLNSSKHLFDRVSIICATVMIDLCRDTVKIWHHTVSLVPNIGTLVCLNLTCKTGPASGYLFSQIRHISHLNRNINTLVQNTVYYPLFIMASYWKPCIEQRSASAHPSDTSINIICEDRIRRLE